MKWLYKFSNFHWPEYSKEKNHNNIHSTHQSGLYHVSNGRVIHSSWSKLCHIQYGNNPPVITWYQRVQFEKIHLSMWRNTQFITEFPSIDVKNHAIHRGVLIKIAFNYNTQARNQLSDPSWPINSCKLIIIIIANEHGWISAGCYRLFKSVIPNVEAFNFKYSIIRSIDRSDQEKKVRLIFNYYHQSR